MNGKIFQKNSRACRQMPTLNDGPIHYVTCTAESVCRNKRRDFLQTLVNMRPEGLAGGPRNGWARINRRRTRVCMLYCHRRRCSGTRWRTKNNSVCGSSVRRRSALPNVSAASESTNRFDFPRDSIRTPKGTFDSIHFSTHRIHHLYINAIMNVGRTP